MDSKDLMLIVNMAVLGFITAISCVQIAGLITGILGINYIFTIVSAIITSFSSLLYEGRRWRFFTQFTLYALLITPTYLGGAPFNIISRLGHVVAGFFGDLLFNRGYAVFKKNNKLMLWSILTTVALWIMIPFFGTLIKPLVYTPEAMAQYVNVVILLSPVIIAESAAGGYIGYKIYKKVKQK
ncbi:MAG: hypothetical protein NWF06_02780 [Candidatus Bathyarchaeota archaeon]|nr:hypothetical protein [Candidatus Bathyarchaeum sp.]